MVICVIIKQKWDGFNFALVFFVTGSNFNTKIQQKQICYKRYLF